MNKILLLLVFFIISYELSSQVYWKEIDNIPVSARDNHFLDVYFLSGSPDYGWIVGFYGQVLRTTNGGDSWTVHTVPYDPLYEMAGGMPGHLESVKFVNPNVGYASGPAGIFKSIDGGVTWRDITDEERFSHWGCFFVDEEYGYAVGDGCSNRLPTIRRTTDGGNTWEIIQIDTPYFTGLTDIIIEGNGRVGYAVSSGFIWQTLDSGLTWDEYSSTGTMVWTEELAKRADFIVLPTSGVNCTGQSFDNDPRGSIRTSTDGGTSWREFSTGASMFGSFILTDRTAYACGDDSSIYKTTNSGLSWERQSCGINDDIDDIWFHGPLSGWAVGTSIYRTVPDSLYVDRDTLIFNKVCPNEIEYKSLFAGAFSERQHVAWAELISGEENFTIISPTQPGVESNCLLQEIIVAYSAEDLTIKEGELKVIIADENNNRTEFIVTLIGEAHEMTTTPLDSIVTIDPAPVGQWKEGREFFTSIGGGDTIINTQKQDEEYGIRLVSKLPIPFSEFSTQELRFEAQPTDTGWIESDYDVVLGPCEEIFTIKVKAYGVSPIINTNDFVDLGIFCGGKIEVDNAKLPITNTGNEVLIIDSVKFEELGLGFELLGLSSQRELPIEIAPGQSDTLLLAFDSNFEIPASTNLIIYNNDKTTTRGDVDEYSVQITADGSSTDVIGINTEIDFGEFCIVNDSVSRIAAINNLGSLTAEILNISLLNNSSQFIFDDVIINDQIPNGAIYEFEISFSLNEIGEFQDTLVIETGPCGDIVYIPIRGVVNNTELQIEEENISITDLIEIDNIFQLNAQFTSTTESNIISYELVPANAAINLQLQQQLPIPAQIGESIDLQFDFVISSDIAQNYTGNICFFYDGECDNTVCVPLNFESIDIQLATESIDFGITECDNNAVIELLEISNIGTREETIENYELRPDFGVFEIITPIELPLRIYEGQSLQLEIKYQANQVGQFESFFVYETSTGRLDSARLYAEHNDTDISVDINYIEAGQFEYCDDILEFPINISNIGNLNNNIEISFANNEDYLAYTGANSFNLYAEETQEIVVSIDPSLIPQTGDFSNELIISSETCPQEIRLPINGNLFEPKLFVDPNPIEFGTVWMDSSSVVMITITNLSDKSIEIHNLIFPQNAEMINANVDFPITIEANSSKEIELVFTAIKEGNFISDMQFVLSLRCEYYNENNWRAFVPKEIYNVDLWIDDYVKEVGEEFIAEIQLREGVPYFKPDGLRLKIAYDHELYYPNIVEVRETEGNYIEVEREIGLGFFTINLDESLSKNLFDTQGTIIRINSLALRNIPDFTPISFTEISPIFDKEINLLTDDGSLEIEEFCISEELYQIVFMGDFSIEVANPANKDMVELTIEATENQNIKYELIDINGGILKGESILIQKGKNFVVLRFNEVASGAYLLKLSNEVGITKTEKIILK